MAKLKLGAIAEKRPVRLTIELPAVLHRDLSALAAFYETVTGLTVKHREKGWISFEAGGCELALHAGQSVVGKRPQKLLFYASTARFSCTGG